MTQNASQGQTRMPMADSRLPRMLILGLREHGELGFLALVRIQTVSIYSLPGNRQPGVRNLSLSETSGHAHQQPADGGLRGPELQ